MECQCRPLCVHVPTDDCVKVARFRLPLTEVARCGRREQAAERMQANTRNAHAQSFCSYVPGQGWVGEVKCGTHVRGGGAEPRRETDLQRETA